MYDCIERALMPSSSADISSVSVAMASLVFSMETSTCRFIVWFVWLCRFCLLCHVICDCVSCCYCSSCVYVCSMFHLCTFDGDLDVLVGALDLLLLVVSLVEGLPLY